MSRYTEQFNNHQIQQSLQTIFDTIENGNFTSDNPDELKEINRFNKIIDNLKYNLEASDPEIISVATLNTFTQPLQNANVQIQAYLNNPSLNSLQQANNNFDQILNTAHSYLLQKPIKNANVASRTIQKIMKEKEDFIESVSKRLEELNEKIDAGDEQAEELKTSVGSLQEVLGNIKTEASELTTTWQDEHTESQATRQQEFETWKTETDDLAGTKITEITDKYSQDIQEKLTTTDTNLKSLIDVSQEHSDKIKNLYGLSATDTVNGGYIQKSKIELNSAILWRRSSVGFLLVAIISVAFAIWLAFHHSSDTPIPSWKLVAIFTPLTTLLLSASGYAASQARNHRQRGVKYQKRGLDLAAIEPYLFSLPNDEQIKFKIWYAKKVFGEEDEKENIVVKTDKATTSH